MTKSIRYILFLILLISVVLSCSTEKYTLLSMSDHGMTAHYNGYFNANELINMSISTYRSALKEDYYSILPIDPVPNATEVTGLYAAIDTAIVKCTKVIQNHSMPSNELPSKKKAEYNQRIDENWTTVGIADYYRRDYEAAMKNFQFIKKFYSNDPTLYIADLWIAKTNIAIGNYTEAFFSLTNLDKAIEAEELLNADKKGFFKKNDSSKEKTKKKDKIAKFPKKIRFDFEKTKAELALKNKNKEDAIKYLEESLKFAKKQTDKARVNFILAQLYEATNNRLEAKDHYSKVLKYNSPYEMNFTSRIRRAFMGGDEKFRKDLMKMLRDAKNLEFKDQIYYALVILKFNHLLVLSFLTLKLDAQDITSK